MKENSDKTYNRTLFIGLIIISVLLVIGVAAAIFFPYYYKYVPRSHTTNFDTTYIKEGTKLEDKKLTLQSYLPNYAFVSELSVSTEREYAAISHSDDPLYIYFSSTKTEDLPVTINFSILTEKYELKSCSFVVKICYSNGDVYDSVEAVDYTQKSFENNSIEIEFFYAKSFFIKSITAKYSFL